jgi:hypothetical protein
MDSILFLSKVHKAFFKCMDNYIHNIRNNKKCSRKLWRLQKNTRTRSIIDGVNESWHFFRHGNWGNLMVLFTFTQYIYEFTSDIIFAWPLNFMRRMSYTTYRIASILYIFQIRKYGQILSIVSTQYKNTPSLLTGSRRQEVDRGVAYNCCGFKIADFYVDQLICTNLMCGRKIDNSLDLVENIWQEVQHLRINNNDHSHEPYKFSLLLLISTTFYLSCIILCINNILF